MTEVAVSQKEIDFTKNEEIEIQASEPVKLEENFKAMTTTEVSTDNWCQENKENQKKPVQCIQGPEKQQTRLQEELLQ